MTDLWCDWCRLDTPCWCSGHARLPAEPVTVPFPTFAEALVVQESPRNGSLRSLWNWGLLGWRSAYRIKHRIETPSGREVWLPQYRSLWPLWDNLTYSRDGTVYSYDEALTLVLKHRKEVLEIQAEAAMLRAKRKSLAKKKVIYIEASEVDAFVASGDRSPRWLGSEQVD